MFRTPATQRGFLLITAVVLIVTVGLLAAVITFLTTGNVLTSASHANSAKALFVAESGLERGIYGYKNGTFCTSLSTLTPPSTVGEGNFAIAGTFNIASIALGANVTATSTVIPVASTAGFASQGRIRIENEDIDYAALTATSFTGAERGVAGSTAAAHNTGAAVNSAQDECVIRSTGTVSMGNTKRIVEKGIQNPGAMMVYAKTAGDNIPYFRRWDGTRWGPERQATPVGAGNTIQYLVLKFARTRNEAILGTLDDSGDILVQVWNGSTWGATTLLANIGDPDFRGFDIEYETSGDRAVVVYNDDTGSPNYVIWNGTFWSAPLNIALPAGAIPIWIELVSNPLSTSNEIVMMVLKDNTNIYARRWDGIAWSIMAGVGGAWDLTTAADNTPTFTKIFDVAYERTSGRAMFVWGDNDQGAGNQRLRYRTWDGASLSLSGITNLPIPNMADVANWVRLAPNPGSTPSPDQIMLGVQDGGRDLNTALWSGGVWTVHAEHDDRTEDDRDRNFDLVFETHPSTVGRAWLVWGRRAGPGGAPAGVRRKQWNGAAWGATTVTGNRTALVQLATQPYTGAVFAAIYEDTASATRDIREMHLTGGSGTWSALSSPSTTPSDPVWAGPTVGNPVMERVFVALERYSNTVDWREIFP